MATVKIVPCLLFSAMDSLIQSTGHNAAHPKKNIQPSSEKIIQKGLLLANDVDLRFDLAGVYFCTSGHMD